MVYSQAKTCINAQEPLEGAAQQSCADGAMTNSAPQSIYM